MDDSIMRMDPNFRVVGWQPPEERKTLKNISYEKGAFKAVIVTRNQDLSDDDGGGFIKIKN